MAHRTASGESVYNVIPPEQYVAPKPPQYKSRFSKMYRDQFEEKARVSRQTDGPQKFGSIRHTQIKSSATMGKAKEPLRGQRNFLRKHEKEPRLPNPQRFDYQDGKGARGPLRKPPVPKANERSMLAEPTQRDFVKQNALEAILKVPKRPKDETVSFRTKPNYGKVPQYLGRVQQEVDEEYRFIASMQQDQMPQERDGMRLLEEEERQVMLVGLKERWEALNKQYQTMGMCLDSRSKVVKKEQLEQELEQIERDIEGLSKRFIFVNVDDENY